MQNSMRIIEIAVGTSSDDHTIVNAGIHSIEYKRKSKCGFGIWDFLKKKQPNFDRFVVLSFCRRNQHQSIQRWWMDGWMQGKKSSSPLFVSRHSRSGGKCVLYVHGNRIWPRKRKRWKICFRRVEKSFLPPPSTQDRTENTRFPNKLHRLYQEKLFVRF